MCAKTSTAYTERSTKYSNTEFEDTISARVSPIIVLKVFLVERLGIVLGFERANLGPIIVLNVFPVERLLRFFSFGALCSRDWR